MDRQLLIDTLTTYTTDDLEEKKFVPAFLELLRHPRAYYRDHLPGHITASALIIDTNGENILLLHHKKLDRWLQPGGHADGEENVLNVAKKEVLEETGLHTLQSYPGVFDIDIHVIPARTDFTEHLHYDIRFLFQADSGARILINDESHALKWFPTEIIPQVTGPGDSILRMLKKAEKLFARE